VLVAVLCLEYARNILERFEVYNGTGAKSIICAKNKKIILGKNVNSEI